MRGLLIGTTVAVVLGQRERREDWLELGRDLVRRGLPPPWLVVTDGAPGLVRAVEELAHFHRVYLALDGDEAGRRAAAQLAAELRGQALIVDLSPGVHDLNDLGRLPDGRGRSCAASRLPGDEVIPWHGKSRACVGGTPRSP